MVIGNHNLDCFGGVLQSRYRDIKSNKCDYVHLYGSSGSKSYTASVVNVLRSAKLVLVNPPKYFDEYNPHHPQARNQAKMRKGKPVQKSETKSKMADNYGYTRTQYSVPTHNKYAKLDGFYQGN